MRRLLFALLALLLSAPASAVNVTIALNPGWNGVTFQGTQVTIINATAVAGMATYGSSGYQTTALTVESVNAGEGTFRAFWIFATGPGELNYIADEATKVFTVNLRSGYNFVGFPSPNNIPGANLSVLVNGNPVPLGSILLPQFYRVLPDGSQVVVDVNAGGQLLPGRPYWIYAASPCQLNFVPFKP